ncbi:MAG TPA: SPASM domain-containing protein, partial [Mycobacterium sp.]|nr:SPASM domain-containing protein [Mycobacterium sp.]
IQTNGTLLTDEWCSFLAEHRFLVGISIDGPRHLHDTHRLDKKGRPTFDRVIEGLQRLQAHRVDVNVLCTVNSANEEHPLEVYRFFRDRLGLRHIQLIPIVERAGPPDATAVTERSVNPTAWGDFLIAVFDEWLARDVGTVFVSHFDAALASWAGTRPGLCIFGETCGDAVALEHNGDVYSCDHFVEPEHLIGNIHRTHLVELLASRPQRDFGLAKRDTLPTYCQACTVRFACQGECPKNRFVPTPDGEPGLNYLCAGYKAFFTHIDGPMRLMADLVRAGRYADEVMGILAGVGRNQPCPCGSGRKAKHCHQRAAPQFRVGA